jgi:hypothetical protein
MSMEPNLRHEYIRGRTEPVQLLYGEESPLLHTIWETYYHLLHEPRDTVVVRNWGGWYPQRELSPSVVRWIMERLEGVTERAIHSAWGCLDQGDHYRVDPAVTQLLYVLPQVLGSENLDLYLHFPESALSPRLQKELADAILESVGASGCRYVIRTHSELMGLRMLRRIRGGLSTDTLRVWHIKDGYPLSGKVNSGGEFVKNMFGLWDDTFDEVF